MKKSFETQVAPVAKKKETPETRMTDAEFEATLLAKAQQASARLKPDAVSRPKDSPNYTYFTADWYVRMKLLDRSMIERLQTGETLLSVGTGPGFLERFLQEDCKIPKSQITISDLKIYPEIADQGFPNVEFDMKEDWPAELNMYDLIIFPESFGVAHMELNTQRHTYRFHEQLQPIIQKALQGMIGTVPVAERNFCAQVIELDLPAAQIQRQTLEKALHHLKPNGEIRLAGSSLSDDQIAYLIIKFKESFPDVQVQKKDLGTGVVLRKQGTV